MSHVTCHVTFFFYPKQYANVASLNGTDGNRATRGEALQHLKYVMVLIPSPASLVTIVKVAGLFTVP